MEWILWPRSRRSYSPTKSGKGGHAMVYQSKAASSGSLPPLPSCLHGADSQERNWTTMYSSRDTLLTQGQDYWIMAHDEVKNHIPYDPPHPFWKTSYSYMTCSMHTYVCTYMHVCTCMYVLQHLQPMEGLSTSKDLRGSYTHACTTELKSS